MNFLANTKKVNLISASASLSGYANTPVSGAVDTAGFNCVTVLLSLYSNNNTGSLTASLQASDTNGSYTALSGTTLITSASAQGNLVWNLDKRMVDFDYRWINLVVTPAVNAGVGTLGLDAKAFLGDPAVGIYNATGNNALFLFEG